MQTTYKKEEFKLLQKNLRQAIQQNHKGSFLSVKLFYFLACCVIIGTLDALYSMAHFSESFLVFVCLLPVCLLLIYVVIMLLYSLFEKINKKSFLNADSLQFLLMKQNSIQIQLIKDIHQNANLFTQYSTFQLYFFNHNNDEVTALLEAKMPPPSKKELKEIKEKQEVSLRTENLNRAIAQKEKSLLKENLTTVNNNKTHML